jgi:hypothetical protein
VRTLAPIPIIRSITIHTSFASELAVIPAPSAMSDVLFEPVPDPSNTVSQVQPEPHSPVTAIAADARYHHTNSPDSTLSACGLLPPGL